MAKNKIILIGAIREGRKPICGETFKNQLFLKRFKEVYNRVLTVDTFQWQKHPWCLIKLIGVLLTNKTTPIVISASGASRYLIRFLHFFPICKNVCFWVVGGNMVEAIDAGRFRVEELNELNHLLVQGRSMVSDLEKCGVNNAIYVPNSKPIIFQPQFKKRCKNEPYKFVFLSRIHPDKGIGEIQKACDLLIRKGYGERFSVDFYGKIENNYKSDFARIIDGNEHLSYRGYLDLTEVDGYKKLSSYDVMLFPTYWDGEGFPGIVIDANIAGVPIIASDWSLNKDVIKDNITGVIIPVHDYNALAYAMKDFIDEKRDLDRMKKDCNSYIQQFDYRNVLSENLFNKIFK